MPESSARAVPLGFIPTGWYPTAVAVTPDEQTLIVANGKGLTSRANVPPQRPNPATRRAR